RRPFTQDLAAEAEQFRRPAARDGRKFASALNKALSFDKAPEVLLVKPNAGDRLDSALQFKQRERWWHEFEDDRAIFHLAVQARDGRRQNPAVSENHAGAEQNIAARRASVARGFLHQAGLVEKFIALQHLFLVPADTVGAEAQPHAVAPLIGDGGCRCI